MARWVLEVGEPVAKKRLDGSTTKAVGDCYWWVINYRGVLPAAARFQQMDDAADNPTIILPPRVWLASGRS
jgi:hypothetical protein